MKDAKYRIMSTKDLLTNLKMAKFALILYLSVFGVILLGLFITICSSIIDGVHIKDSWPFYMFFAIAALFSCCIVCPLNNQMKKIKGILQERGYSEEDDQKAKASAKKLLTILITCLVIFFAIALVIVLSSRSNSGSGSSKRNESFSDYIKEENPDLYNDIVDRYNSLK